jgi:DNA-binding HxlR family transcriptional regulator
MPRGEYNKGLIVYQLFEYGESGFTELLNRIQVYEKIHPHSVHKSAFYEGYKPLISERTLTKYLNKLIEEKIIIKKKAITGKREIYCLLKENPQQDRLCIANLYVTHVRLDEYLDHLSSGTPMKEQDIEALCVDLINSANAIKKYQKNKKPASVISSEYTKNSKDRNTHNQGGN